ncbi:heme NO-binding domain-containing protein [Natronosalvus vescus]|uniref:heme NO-binding domain-containing protein n=1 Tax=Natronosalvus vescus TaxID=2953881 RepID=UPI0020906025|nr:heme NO-binding domain-containing protein [Natronosalvus vescus]
MHGLVHQTLKTYVVDKTDEASWTVVLDRAGIDPQLYLQISHYPDDEIPKVLETVAQLSGHERTIIERDFGRTLGPALLQTFRAHWRNDWSYPQLLSGLEAITDEIRSKDNDTEPPTLSCMQAGDGLRVTYRSSRDYPAIAHGVLEGMAREFNVDVTVTRLETRRVNGDTECVFLVEGLE